MSCRRGEVEERVLNAIRPSPVQLHILNRYYNLIKANIESCLSRTLRGVEYSIEPVGSFAKGTILSDKWELDVFVLLGVERKWIKMNGEALLHRCLSPFPRIVRYAEHPYVTVTLMGLQADVVPAPLLRRAHGAMGVERTPFHTRWVKDRIAREPCLADEVRLLKSFLKGIGAYGAEASVGGFSGYLAEVLTIASRGFREVLGAASEWRPPVYYDPEGWGSEERLRRRYPDSPLLVPDPVDPDRNVAAAVTLRRLAEFILASRIYLESPAESFFHAIQPKVEARLVPGVLVYFNGDFHLHSPEAVWGRIKRLADSIYREARRHGFPVTHYSFWTDESSEALVYVGSISTSLQPIEVARGPEAWARHDRVARFLAKRWVEAGYVWVAPDGSLEGVRLRMNSSLSGLARRVVESLPKPPGTRMVIVAECPGDEKCSLARQHWLSDPTPKWLRLAMEWAASRA